MKRTLDRDNKTLCCRCKRKPRRKYQNYCRECGYAYHREWVKKRGGYWESLTPEQRRRATVRTYIHNLIKRGKIDPEPCKVCGEPAQIHHLNYERMSLDVQWLCKTHHDEMERAKKYVDKIFKKHEAFIS